MPHLIFAALDPMGIIMTVLGLGFLIFFHELGHFIACRLTGTRVEAFSIGFGPKLFGWKHGNTVFKVSAIPLGGYVKMAAENPGDARSDDPDEFPNKSFLQRLFIMSNGVIFNVILALLLYVGAFRAGVPFRKAQLGRVSPGGPGWVAGLQPGDLITHVNGKRILGFEDVHMAVAFSDKGEVIEMTVNRNGTPVDVAVRPTYSESGGMPMIDVDVAPEPAMAAVEEDTPLEKAGGRAGDTVLAVDGRPVISVHDFVAFVNRAVGEATDDDVTVQLKVRRADDTEATFAVPVTLVDHPQVGILPFSGNVVQQMPADTLAGRWVHVGDTILSINGRAVTDLRVYGDLPELARQVTSIQLIRDGKRRTVVPDAPLTERKLADSIMGVLDFSSNRVSPRAGMPASRAGVRVGDRIVKVGESKITTWEKVRDAIQAAGMDPIRITVARGDEEVDLTIAPARSAKYAALGYVPERALKIHRETDIFAAVAVGWKRTVLAGKSVILTIRSLATRRVSAKHVGGPIMLAQITYNMFDVGLGRYLWILAMISINLAILNILPIPILDGGQIVLLCAEKLRGKPLPDRVVGYFQMVGLLMILSLMALAFTNDIVRLLS